MNVICEACTAPFVVRDQDLGFLERIAPTFAGERCAIPAPRRCPACREQLRMAWRNERHLFVRNCDRTGDRLVSIFPPAVPFPVYRHREWFKDHNDATVFGRAYDPSMSVFSQMAELQRQAPRFHVYNFQEELDVNSQYTNCAGNNKNCYLIFASGYNEQCLYGRYTNHCFDCVDAFFLERCRCCYESSDMTNCERVFFGRQCNECHDAYFLYDCRGCHDCIGCSGLRRRQYCIFNEQLTRSAYESQVEELALHTRAGLEGFTKRFDDFLLSAVRRAVHGEQNENSCGDYLSNTKDCYYCFDTRNAEECSYCTFFVDGKSSMDIYSWGEMELCYQISGGGSYGEYRSAFTAKSFGCKESYYLDHCVFCEHCFACVGLNRQKYCILNRQYSPADYEKTVAWMVREMSNRGEWGEFLPATLSPFGYNYSVAMDFYPLKREEALAHGFTWSDYQAPQSKPTRIIEEVGLPATVAEMGDDILEATIRCAQSGKFFKLTKAEIAFYRANNLPPPALHPDLRQMRRMLSRNPHYLWQRGCAQCGVEITTAYAPQRPEKVLCEKCYQGVVV